MEDTTPCFDLNDFPYFQGIDLTLWVQLVLVVALAALGGGIAWSVLG